MEGFFLPWVSSCLHLRTEFLQWCVTSTGELLTAKKFEQMVEALCRVPILDLPISLEVSKTPLILLICAPASTNDDIV